jgi:photosystem II stability/assembly factor-like uncharacterized protein
VPLPTLDRVPLSVWANSSTEAYVVGGGLGSGGEALLLRREGLRWRILPTNTDATLWWVHGVSPRSVWMVGERGTILHFDGRTVTPFESGTDRTLYGVWGTSDNDLWAVGGKPGSDGILLHKDENGWTTIPAPITVAAFFKVWGSDGNDVFVCGEGGTMLHYDGTTWSIQPTGLSPEVTLFTVAGRAPNDVYAVGGFGRGAAIHYDGTGWYPVEDPRLVEVGSLAGVAVQWDGSVLIVGAAGLKLRGMPGALLDESSEPPLTDLHGAALAEGTAFAVGGNYLSPAGAVRQGMVATR